MKLASNSPLPFLLFCLAISFSQSCKKKPAPTPNTLVQTTIIPIESARSLPLGSKATIQGTVTVPSGVFSSSIPYGYAIQDITGGIYIVDSIPPMQGAFSMNQIALVTGIIEESNGLLYLREASATIEGEGMMVQPIEVSTGEVGPTNEGDLVSTSGTIDSIKNDMPYGYKVYINDGSGPIDIYVNASSNLIADTALWKISQEIRATGFSSQYGTKYECDVRISGDIEIINY